MGTFPPRTPPRSRDRSRPGPVPFPVAPARPRQRTVQLAGLAAAVLLLFLAGAFPAHADQPTPPRTKNLTVALDNAYPPYIFPAQSGGFQGILVDLWKLWEQKTGVPVTLVPMEWSAAQEFMREGKADVIDMLFATEARQRLYTFSKPYATLGVTVFVHKELGGIRDLDTLRGFTVGVKKGDASVDYLTDRGVLPLVALDGYEDVVRAAGKGAFKVFCVDTPPGLHYLYKLNLQDDFRLAFTLYSGQFHRAVRKGDEALLTLVEDGFTRITADERAAIDKKWLGATLFPSPLVRYAPWIAAGIGLALAGLLVFTAVLRRTVRRQTARMADLLEAMGRSEERYRELVQGAGSVIVRLTPSGTITFCNDYAQRFFGYSPGEMIGRGFAERLGVDEATLNDDLEALRRETGSPAPQGASLVREALRRDGGRVWIAWSLQALRGPDGQLVELLCVGNDITERKRAEEALRQSEERYALVARGANDGIWDWNLCDNSVYFSPRYLEILGYAPGEMALLVDEWTKRIHPDDAEAVIRENKRCADGMVDLFSSEYRLRHRDGTYRWILGRGTSLRDADGRVVRMAGTHTDITRRKKDEVALRESQDQLAKIFRFTPVGITLTTRRDSRILDVNEACTRMFGFAKADVLGHTTLELGIWRRMEDRDKLLAAMPRSGSVVGMEVELRHKSGAPIVALCSAVYNQAYGEPCILSVLVDITERKAMEQALVRAKEAAETANRAKSEFLSTMSHEIRTPMNTILGMVDVLAATPLSERQTHAIQAIELAGANLLGLLNNILDLSHIEAGGLIMEEQRCDPAELAGRVVDMLLPDATRKGLDLRLTVADDLPRAILCCQERIRQVLVNLVGNALKFTPQGEIEVGLGRDTEPRTGEPRLVISVRDTGIGIAPDKQPLIFDRFTQVNAGSNRQFGGVGLGLAICKRLVDMMGGHIGVQSREGQGATFTVHLPLREAADQASPGPAVPGSGHRPGPGRGSVLLVEDSATNAEVLRLMLEDSPFAVTWAPSGQAALEILRDQPFDIVLMDVEMPGLDGYQTTEALRRQEAQLGRPRTPVIALTAHAFEEHQQRSLASGCDDFQIKPIPKARLLEILETWMSLRTR